MSTTIETQSEAIERATRLIVEAIHPEQIYLFGSRARGDAKPDSDYDWLVVVSDDFAKLNNIIVTASDLMTLLYHSIGVSDVIVASKTHFSKWSESRFHVIGRAVREGVITHG